LLREETAHSPPQPLSIPRPSPNSPRFSFLTVRNDFGLAFLRGCVPTSEFSPLYACSSAFPAFPGRPNRARQCDGRATHLFLLHRALTNTSFSQRCGPSRREGASDPFQLPHAKHPLVTLSSGHFYCATHGLSPTADLAWFLRMSRPLETLFWVRLFLWSLSLTHSLGCDKFAFMNMEALSGRDFFKPVGRVGCTGFANSDPYTENCVSLEPTFKDSWGIRPASYHFMITQYGCPCWKPL